MLYQGPAATVDVVRKIIREGKVGGDVKNLAGSEKVKNDIEEGKTGAQGVEQSHKVDRNETQAEDAAEVAAEVADSAQTLDEGLQVVP